LLSKITYISQPGYTNQKSSVSKERKGRNIPSVVKRRHPSPQFDTDQAKSKSMKQYIIEIANGSVKPN